MQTSTPELLATEKKSKEKQKQKGDPAFVYYYTNRGKKTAVELHMLLFCWLIVCIIRQLIT